MKFKVKNAQGTWEDILSLQGPKGNTGPAGPVGPAGQNAYQAAQQGGYTATQEQFYADLASMQTLASLSTVYYSPIVNMTASKTSAMSDLGKTIMVNSSSNLTYTVTKGVSDGLPIGFEVAILRYGAGTVTIALSGGIYLINSAEGTRTNNGRANISERYSMAALKKLSATDWLLTGGTENV